MKFSRLFLISLLAVLTLVLVQLPASTSGSTGNPIVATSLTGNPIATAAVSGSTVTAVASPNKPSALASYTITFNVDADLDNGVDEIIIIWDEDFKDFPSVIANSAVSIRATAVTGLMGTPGQAVAPEEVNVDFVNPENGDTQPQTRLRVPDMDVGHNSGGNGIAAFATVTVVFRQAAGITNPHESNDNYHFDVRVTAAGVDPGAGASVRAVPDLFIQARMLPSNDDGKRGQSRTFFASGIEGNESITFFRDANGDGLRQVTEPVVCRIVAVADDTATCTFTISSPPFVPGKFGTDPGDSCAVGAMQNCNFINFLDSESRTTTGENSEALDQAAVNRQVFFLDQTITATPALKAEVGKTLAISMFDWPSNSTVTRIRIAGKDVAIPVPAPETNASGEASFDFVIPEVDLAGNPIRLGKVPFRVNTQILPTGPRANEDTNITISE